MGLYVSVNAYLYIYAGNNISKYFCFIEKDKYACSGSPLSLSLNYSWNYSWPVTVAVYFLSHTLLCIVAWIRFECTLHIEPAPRPASALAPSITLYTIYECIDVIHICCSILYTRFLFEFSSIKKLSAVKILNETKTKQKYNI